MTDILNIINNCTTSGSIIKLPTNIGIEKRIFNTLKYQFSLLNGTWEGGDTFGFKFQDDADLLNILETLKTKIQND